MPTEVTDPALLAQLNGPQEVTDPHLLAQLNGSDEGPPETVGRVAGLGARALGEGTADTASTITNAMEEAQGPLSMPLQAVQAAVPTSTSKEPTLSDFIHPARWKNAVDYLADKAGLAKPETAGERIGSKAVEALPSAVLAPGAPIAGAASAALGAGTSQAVKEAGGGPWAQTLSGLVAGSIPGIASNAGAITRRVLGGDSAEETGARIKTAAQSNTTLPAGAATGSKFLQKAEATSGALWGGGPIERAAERRATSLDSHISDIVDNLTPPGATLTPMGAGTAITKGVAGTMKAMDSAEDVAYSKLDSLVPADTPIDVSGTLGKLDALAKPTPGAEATTGALTSPKISALRDNLTADMTSNAAKNSPPPYVNITRAPQPDAIAEAITQEKQASTLPYSAVRAIRTKVGNSIDRGFAPADPMTNGALKQTYGALSDDLNSGVAQVSPQAKAAADAASSLYKANKERGAFLDSVVNQEGGPEKVFEAATGDLKNGATTISKVMGALGPDEQNVVRATILNRLGRAVPSSQDATGSVFSPESFLTKWNQMAPESKDALFGASAPANQLRSNLDSFASTISTLKNSRALKNPSGSGKLIGHAVGAANMMSDVMIGLFTGHPIALSGLALPAVNNIAARALTNPTVVKWLAQSAKLPTSAIPNAVNQLMNVADPDARNLAGYLTAASQEPQDRVERASGGKVDIDTLVTKLIRRWHAAKRETNEATKPLLRESDSTIVKALDLAQQHI